jgi:hypothetical protein
VPLSLVTNLLVSPLLRTVSLEPKSQQKFGTSPIILRHLGNIGFISVFNFALFFAPPVHDAGRSFEKK